LGVQVSTVWLAFQDGVAGKKPTGLISKKVASVRLVSIASLKVKTIVVVVETPPAPSGGVVESNMGCACVSDMPPSNPSRISIGARTLITGLLSECMGGFKACRGDLSRGKKGGKSNRWLRGLAKAADADHSNPDRNWRAAKRKICRLYPRDGLVTLGNCEALQVFQKLFPNCTV
jgi:hypothetical protein